MRFLTLLLIVIIGFSYSNVALALSLIRDEETERYLKDIARPVFRAAGLHADNVRIFIVNDPTLNAYVSGGMNIFIHTGLITESDDPDMLIGVFAHEAGHIEGGHLSRMQDEFENVGMGATLSYLLGIASVAAGAPAAGQAIMSGGAHIAERTALGYTRAHEEEADQAAVRILRDINISPEGLLTLLGTLRSEQTFMHGDVDPYAVTHPMSKSRMASIRSHIIANPSLKKETPTDIKKLHQRVRAKLLAFLEPYERTLATDAASGDSFLTKYARAIALHKKAETEQSLAILDDLIKKYPTDAYLHELRGQIAFESGRISESIISYKKALQYIPEAPMIQLGLAIALLASGDVAEVIEEAIARLQKVLVTEKNNMLAWRQIAIGYGKNGHLGMSYLALAEAASLSGNEDNVKKYVSLVKKYEKDSSPAILRAEDILKMMNKK